MFREDVFPNFYRAARIARRCWRRLWALLRWSGRALRVLLPGLAFALLAAYVIANVSAGRALEQELARIRAQGEPLSLREAAPPLVPDYENAALVYEEAFHRLPRLRMRYEPGVGNEPRLSPADDRVLTRFLPVRADEQGTLSLRDLRRTLAGTGPALTLVRKAAAMPRCRFPVNWEAGAYASFPHYTMLLSLSRLLAAHAVVAAADGRPAAADLHALVGIARHPASDPVMIGQVVAYQCLRIAAMSLRRVLEFAPLSKADSRRLDEDLTGVDLYHPYARAVLSERCLGLWTFDLARRDPAKLMSALFQPGDSNGRPLLWRALARLGAPVLKMDELCYLQYMAAEVARAQAEHQVRPAGMRDVEPQFPSYARITYILSPAFTGVIHSRDEVTARLDLAQWALALNVYRQQFGQFPPSLDAAGRRLGWNLPRDPFTGSELSYRRQGHGYLLYSWGPNGQDDEGADRPLLPSPPGTPPPGPRTQGDRGPVRLNRSPRPGQPPFDTPDDIAWRFARQQQPAP